MKEKSLVYRAQGCQPIRTFDQYKLLGAFSINIGEGDWISIVGPNGCGKSTLGRWISGHQRGDLTFTGMENRYQHPMFPMITQLTSQYLLGATPYEDLIICYEQFGYSGQAEKIEQEIDDLLHMLQLEHLKHASIDLLSGGEKQLVAFAGALLMNSKLIIMDEITSMLSEQNKWHVCSIIRKLAKERAITILWITQHLDELHAGDNLWVMSSLDIVYQGRAGSFFIECKQHEKLKEQLSVPWSVGKSIELGLPAEEIQFSIQGLAELMRGHERATH